VSLVGKTGRVGEMFGVSLHDQSFAKVADPDRTKSVISKHQISASMPDHLFNQTLGIDFV